MLLRNNMKVEFNASYETFLETIKMEDDPRRSLASTSCVVFHRVVEEEPEFRTLDPARLNLVLSIDGYVLGQGNSDRKIFSLVHLMQNQREEFPPASRCLVGLQLLLCNRTDFRALVTFVMK